MGKRSIDIDSLSLPVFRRWITGTEVIASMVGVGVLAMAAMGATGGTWKASGDGRVESVLPRGAEAATHPSGHPRLSLHWTPEIREPMLAARIPVGKNGLLKAAVGP